jgi:hypothetical protein
LKYSVYFKNILGDPPDRPKSGPAAEIDLSDKALEELLNQQAGDLKTECELPEDTKTSWSLHFAEKPVNIIGDHNEKINKNMEQSDFIQFSIDKSDLIKFSLSNEEKIEELPKQISDLMKFSDIKVADEPEVHIYT